MNGLKLIKGLTRISVWGAFLAVILFVLMFLTVSIIITSTGDPMYGWWIFRLGMPMIFTYAALHLANGLGMAIIYSVGKFDEADRKVANGSGILFIGVILLFLLLLTAGSIQ